MISIVVKSVLISALFCCPFLHFCQPLNYVCQSEWEIDAYKIRHSLTLYDQTVGLVLFAVHRDWNMMRSTLVICSLPTTINIIGQSLTLCDPLTVGLVLFAVRSDWNMRSTCIICSLPITVNSIVCKHFYYLKITNTREITLLVH